MGPNNENKNKNQIDDAPTKEFIEEEVQDIQMRLNLLTDIYNNLDEVIKFNQINICSNSDKEEEINMSGYVDEIARLRKELDFYESLSKLEGHRIEKLDFLDDFEFEKNKQENDEIKETNMPDPIVNYINKEINTQDLISKNENSIKNINIITNKIDKGFTASTLTGAGLGGAICGTAGAFFGIIPGIVAGVVGVGIGGILGGSTYVGAKAWTGVKNLKIIKKDQDTPN